MTPQQHADQLLSEHQRERTMTLQDWDQKVKPHLNYIEAGAEMAARHARMLLCKPDFPSKAQAELAETRAVLEAALQSVIAAQSIYVAKPLENNRAA